MLFNNLVETQVDRLYIRLERGMRPDGTVRNYSRPARRKGLPSGRYAFKPHSGRRERTRRLRQAYRGHVAPGQFQTPQHFESAQMIYLHLVSLGEAA